MSVWTIFKLLHVFAGVFWIGAAVIMSLFLAPAVRALGPSGGAIMKHLAVNQKLPLWINVAAVLTVACGLALYWARTGGLAPVPTDTSYGFGLMFGSVSGLAAFLWGVFYQGRNAGRMSRLAAELQGAPTPEQAAALSALQKKLHIGGIVGVVLLALALAGMLLTHPL